MDGQPELNLHVLGELTATRDGAVVDLGGRRQRAVLAALAMQRDQVVTGGPPRRLRVGRPPARQRERGAAGVRQPPAPAARARRDRPPARTESSPVPGRATCYAWHRTPWTRGRSRPRSSRPPGQAPGDAVCTLETALRMWRGPAYVDYAGEAWAEAEIARLTELRGVARERLLGTRLELGEAQLVIGDLEALVKEDPLREERWRLLTLALYRAHRQAAALEALRRARDGARRRARRRPRSRPARARGGGARPVARPRRTDPEGHRTRPHSSRVPAPPTGSSTGTTRWPS